MSLRKTLTSILAGIGMSVTANAATTTSSVPTQASPVTYESILASLPAEALADIKKPKNKELKDLRGGYSLRIGDFNGNKKVEISPEQVVALFSADKDPAGYVWSIEQTTPDKKKTSGLFHFKNGELYESNTGRKLVFDPKNTYAVSTDIALRRICGTSDEIKLPGKKALKAMGLDGILLSNTYWLDTKQPAVNYDNFDSVYVVVQDNLLVGGVPAVYAKVKAFKTLAKGGNVIVENKAVRDLDLTSVADEFNGKLAKYCELNNNQFIIIGDDFGRKAGSQSALSADQIVRYFRPGSKLRAGEANLRFLTRGEYVTNATADGVGTPIVNTDLVRSAALGLNGDMTWLRHKNMVLPYLKKEVPGTSKLAAKAEADVSAYQGAHPIQSANASALVGRYFTSDDNSKLVSALVGASGMFDRVPTSSIGNGFNFDMTRYGIGPAGQIAVELGGNRFVLEANQTKGTESQHLVNPQYNLDRTLSIPSKLTVVSANGNIVLPHNIELRPGLDYMSRNQGGARTDIVDAHLEGLVDHVLPKAGDLKFGVKVDYIKQIGRSPLATGSDTQGYQIGLKVVKPFN